MSSRSCEHAQTECPTCWRERIGSIGFAGHRVNASGQFRRDAEKQRESDLASYRQTRREGSQPDGTQRHQIERAKRVSDALGTAYRGDDKTGMVVNAGMADYRPHTEAEKRHFRTGK